MLGGGVVIHLIDGTYELGAVVGVLNTVLRMIADGATPTAAFAGVCEQLGAPELTSLSEVRRAQL